MKPIPSILQLYNKFASDLKTRLNISDADLKFVLDSMSAVLTGQLKICYLYIKDVEDNGFPDTADTEANGGSLERQGRIRLGRDPFPAENGVYSVKVTGTAGAIIRAQLTFQSTDNSNAPGNLYILNNAYTLTGNNDLIELTSVDPGLDFELKVGDNLAVTEPVLGLDDIATVDSITTSPVEAEDIETYRDIILQSYRIEPQGGSKTDYRKWASDVQGVRLVYPYVKNGAAGVVQVYVEAIAADSTDGFGTPPQSIIDEVVAAIEFSSDETLETNDRGRRPIQAILEPLPIHIVPVDILVTGLQVNNATIRSEITTNVTTYLTAVRPYISGADLPRDKNDILTSVKLQGVVNDSLDASNLFLGFSMFVDGVQVNSYTFTLGNIPYLRNVNFN